MSDAEEIAELEAELVIVKAAISNLLKGGQSYSINTRNFNRTFTSAQLPELRSYRNEIESRIKSLQGTRFTHIRPGW